MPMIHITETVVLDEREISERFVRSAGSGGQNRNKNASAVELRLDIPRSSLPKDVKERLIAKSGRHVTADGVLIVVGRADRSQARNRSAAHARLLALLEGAAKAPATRKPTTVSPAALQRRVTSRKGSARTRSRITLDAD